MMHWEPGLKFRLLGALGDLLGEGTVQRGPLLVRILAHSAPFPFQLGSAPTKKENCMLLGVDTAAPTHTHTQSSPLPTAGSCHVCSFPGEQTGETNTFRPYQLAQNCCNWVFWTLETHSSVQKMGGHLLVHAHSLPRRWAPDARKPGSLRHVGRASLAGNRRQY